MHSDLLRNEEQEVEEKTGDSETERWASPAIDWRIQLIKIYFDH